MNLVAPFKQLEAVLFDLDGTFADTAQDFAGIINDMRIELGLGPLDYLKIREQVSRGGSGLVEACLDCALDAPEFPGLLSDFLSRYETANGNAAALFPGVEKLIYSCDQCAISWGIVTNKPERFTLPLVKKLTLGESNVYAQAKVVICPDQVKYKKPHPESLNLAARLMGVDPVRAIYIGDDERDIQAGRSAGMLTCAFAGGFVQPGSDITKWQADYQVNSFAQLTQLLFDVD